jgi:hypothetical protein
MTAKSAMRLRESKSACQQRGSANGNTEHQTGIAGHLFRGSKRYDNLCRINGSVYRSAELNGC